jgi:ubiquinone biosynthesis protein
MIGLRSFSRQLMDSGIFHADPHPGNTIVMYDGRVSLVDFGIVGYLDEETMLQVAHLFLGLRRARLRHGHGGLRSCRPDGVPTA